MASTNGIGTTYCSLLVRLWWKPNREGGDWTGEVEHVQTGKRWRFDSLQEMLDILSRPETFLGEPRDEL